MLRKRFAISLCAFALTMFVMGCSQPAVQAPPPAAEQPPAAPPAPPVDRQAEFSKFPEREFFRHGERNHQGLGNELVNGTSAMAVGGGRIRRRQRLGGLLNYYARAA